ncbi:hypothetical protein QM999_16885 [Pectobacterium cacticida]|uniref:hypothetical protein n=2 Tax=Pectobacterium cacticida TaxID=69221 RepID=UPI002FF2ABC7
MSRREPFRSLLWDGEASAGCGLARPARQAVKQGGPRRGPHGAEMASTGTSKAPRDCEPRAASAAGLGRGRGKALQRRDAGTASALGLTLMLAED